MWACGIMKLCILIFFRGERSWVPHNRKDIWMSLLRVIEGRLRIARDGQRCEETPQRKSVRTSFSNWVGLFLVGLVILT